MSCILGIDPGSRSTGFGLIISENRRNRYVGSGCIKTEGNSIAPRLKEIYTSLGSIIDEHRPDCVAIEKVFMHRNADAALKLGQARGAAIVAAVSRNLPVHEYSPNQIKQAVVGRGHADKVQVQHMMKILLNLVREPQNDAADALAVAVCHANTQQYLDYCGEKSQ